MTPDCDHLVALGACRELLQATRAQLTEMIGLADQLQIDLRGSMARVQQAELAVIDAIDTAGKEGTDHAM